MCIRDRKRVNRTIVNSIDYMKKNLDSQLDLNSLVTYTNMSKYHYIRTFKKEIGITPIQFYNELKLKSARKLLMETSLNINEISCRLGYSTPFYFSECFKKYYGFSPSEYRMRLEKEY